jgi:hypothetical protein
MEVKLYQGQNCPEAGPFALLRRQGQPLRPLYGKIFDNLLDPRNASMIFASFML